MGGKKVDKLLTIEISMDEMIAQAQALIVAQISELAEDVWNEAQESGEPVTPELLKEKLIEEMYF